MTLDEVLKQRQKAEEEKKRAEKEKKDADYANKAKFRDDAATLFTDVVRPAIEDIIRTFAANNISANRQQLVKQAKYDAHAVETVSALIDKIYIQLDIIAPLSSLNIDFVFNSNPQTTGGKAYSLKVSEVTPEKISHLVGEFVAKI